MFDSRMAEARYEQVSVDSSSPHQPSVLYDVEYKLLFAIQGAVPVLTPCALFVHYLISQEVLAFVLAAVVWLTSLPLGASVIACATLSQVVNTIVKWIFQRPRPQWYSANNGITNVDGTWQEDFSFPSAHSQFASCFLLCLVCSLELQPAWLGATILVTLIAGITRNYLALHWCSDTLIGWSLGAFIGFAWGTLNPYDMMLQRFNIFSPFWSPVVLASGVVFFLVLCLLGARAVFPAPDEVTVAKWYSNALATLPNSGTKTEEKYTFKSRTFDTIAPELTTAWCALAFAGVDQLFLPSESLEMCYSHALSLRTYCLRVVLGLLGLLILALPMVVIKKSIGSSGTAKCLFKVFVFAVLCTWVFFGSHIMLEALELRCTGVRQ